MAHLLVIASSQARARAIGDARGMVGVLVRSVADLVGREALPLYVDLTTWGGKDDGSLAEAIAARLTPTGGPASAWRAARQTRQ